jgi:hypothetical protein
MWGTYEIEADSFEEAVEEALDRNDFPADQTYLHHSTQLDSKEMIRDVNGKGSFQAATPFTEADETYIKELKYHV